jgi:uncharacterized protein YjgD (DUF1641 family)
MEDNQRREEWRVQDDRPDGVIVAPEETGAQNTALMLRQVMERLEAVEMSMTRLAHIVEQAPAALGLTADVVDQAARRASANGIDLEERLKTAWSLVERLTAPAMVERLDKLAALGGQAPGMVAMAGDVLDDTVRRAAAGGVDVEERLKGALALAERLTAPAMVARLEAVLSLAEQAPAMMATAGDVFDDTVRRAAANGIDLDERLRAALTLADALTDPERVAKITQLLALADEAPKLLAMVGDVADSMASRVQLDARMQAALALADKATRSETLEHLGALLDVLLEAESGMLNPDAVRTVGRMADALVLSKQAPSARVGLLGALRAARDPDVQRALAFLVEFGRQLGRKMNT